MKNSSRPCRGSVAVKPTRVHGGTPGTTLISSSHGSAQVVHASQSFLHQSMSVPAARCMKKTSHVTREFTTPPSWPPQCYHAHVRNGSRGPNNGHADQTFPPHLNVGEPSVDKLAHFQRVPDGSTARSRGGGGHNVPVQLAPGCQGHHREVRTTTDVA